MAESAERQPGAGKRGEHLFCPYCGTEDKIDYGYCDHCGERVSAPESVRYSPNELGKCQVCSTENLLHARHCVGCGASLEEHALRQSGRLPDNSPLRDAAYPDPAAHEGSEEPEIPLRPARRPSHRRRGRSAREEFDRWGQAEMDEVSGKIEEEERREAYERERTESETPNDSGTRDAELPPELQGFNWGACLLGPVWAIGNRVWPATLLFVLLLVNLPAFLGLFIYIAGVVYLGIHANRFAWRAKRWSGVEHFRRTQQSWAFWGFIISPVILFMLVTVPQAASS